LGFKFRIITLNFVFSFSSDSPRDSPIQSDDTLLSTWTSIGVWHDARVAQPVSSHRLWISGPRWSLHSVQSLIGVRTKRWCLRLYGWSPSRFFARVKVCTSKYHGIRMHHRLW